VLRRKQFFFEKKKQKTFAPLPQHGRLKMTIRAASNEQKFFVSFFQKRNTSFLR
jgi:hypothetical protein